MSEVNFLITADIHYDLYENLSIKDDVLLTKRAYEIQNAFQDVCNYAVNNNIENIVVAGDLFHRRNIRQDSVNSLVFNTMSNMSINKGLTIHLLSGNHDQGTVSGKVTALTPLKKVTQVYTKPTIEVIDGFEFHFLPYEEYKGTAKSIELLLKKSENPNRILIAHAGVAGAKISGFDHISKEPLAISDLQLDKYIHAYLGHYHEPQKIAENAMYAGALVQHSFKDCGSERGFWHVKLELVGRKWKANNTFIPSKSPKFHQVTYEEYKKGNFAENDYIKVLKIDRVEKEELRDDPRIVGSTREIITSTEEKSLDLESTWEEQISKYIDMECEEKRRRNRLKKLGKEML